MSEVALSVWTNSCIFQTRALRPKVREISPPRGHSEVIRDGSSPQFSGEDTEPLFSPIKLCAMMGMYLFHPIECPLVACGCRGTELWLQRLSFPIVHCCYIEI